MVPVYLNECVSAQSCPTLCNPPDCSPPGSSVHRILQARILEWVAIYFPRGSSQRRDRTCITSIFCIGGRFFTTEPPEKPIHTYIVHIFRKRERGFTHMCILSRFSHVQLFATPWTVAHQAPLSMGFSRKEYWSGLPCPLQRIFLTQGSNLHLLCLLHW